MPILLTIGLKLLSIGNTALAWLKTLPWYVLALAACVGVILWQHGAETRKDARIASLSATAAQMNAAQAEATRLASEALHHQEQVYQAKAKEADDAHQSALAGAQSAADRYIATHGVCSASAGRTASAATAATPGADPGIHESLPTGAVVVSADDVHACTAAVSYGLNARDYVLSISAASTSSAEPTDGN